MSLLHTVVELKRALCYSWQVGVGCAGNCGSLSDLQTEGEIPSKDGWTGCHEEPVNIPRPHG